MNDVVGMATTPKGLGYLGCPLQRAGLRVGVTRQHLRDFVASPCDPVVAIFSRPGQQGYRLVTRGGAWTFGFGGIGPFRSGPIRRVLQLRH